MDEERLIELLVALHEELDRLGPGDRASTLRAFARCSKLPSKPEILDIGCGSGAQTLVLASATQGRITAVDRFAPFLRRLVLQASRRKLNSRIRVVRADMAALPFEDNAFDLIWSEGAVYIMGFDQGLTAWRRLLRPGGYLVVSEISWFRPDPPAELARFWREQYPAIRSIEENLKAAAALGWMPVTHLHLPADAWTREYYGPLRQRIPHFLEAHPGDPQARIVVEMTQLEMSIMERYPEFCGYEFYVLRREEDGVADGADNSYTES